MTKWKYAVQTAHIDLSNKTEEKSTTLKRFNWARGGIGLGAPKYMNIAVCWAENSQPYEIESFFHCEFVTHISTESRVEELRFHSLKNE